MVLPFPLPTAVERRAAMFARTNAPAQAPFRRRRGALSLLPSTGTGLSNVSPSKVN
jgi:hypothetical protein